MTKTTSAHCSSCGSTDYEDLHTGDQGYTACCNKRVCYGDCSETYGTPAKNVKACCWGTATAAFGGFENVPSGASRLS